ncbi:MAG TPA: homoserine kinase, partial [Burkholderiales bacterium]|nr:homoserine kinase [Burkholderiales bacterium]
MSVFTRVTPEELSAWLKRYAIGTLVDLQGIAAGIENTNYFVTTSHGRFVLTLFERLSPGQLPFYLNLMAHLARHGIPCPAPIADRNDEYLGILKGKPATLVTCLPGAPLNSPQPRHCGQVGAILGAMHLAGKSYDGALDNPRGPKWWREAAGEVAPFLDARRRELLASELGFQAGHRDLDLPRGPVHADLFRDNVLFEADRIGGVIDFYFAGIDAFLFDVAVTLNDWCVDPAGEIDGERASALLAAYRRAREFTRAEREA